MFSDMRTSNTRVFVSDIVMCKSLKLKTLKIPESQMDEGRKRALIISIYTVYYDLKLSLDIREYFAIL